MNVAGNCQRPAMKQQRLTGNRHWLSGNHQLDLRSFKMLNNERGGGGRSALNKSSDTLSKHGHVRL